jgi:hypothetical protein
MAVHIHTEVTRLGSEPRRTNSFETGKQCFTYNSGATLLHFLNNLIGFFSERTSCGGSELRHTEKLALIIQRVYARGSIYINSVSSLVAMFCPFDIKNLNLVHTGCS